MTAKKVYGPTMPSDDLLEKNIETDDSNFLNDQFKSAKRLCETIGPLLPGCELLEEARHITSKTDDNNVKPNANLWMTEMLEPSKINPLKNLKSRGFSMDSKSYLNFNTENLSKPDSRESLMDIHRKQIGLIKTEETVSLNFKDKKSKKKKSRDSHSSDERKRKLKKKSKRHHKDKVDIETKEKKAKLNKSNPVNPAYKWCPFSVSSTRKSFSSELEMRSAGNISTQAKTNIMKQAHNMYNEFVVSSKK